MLRFQREPRWLPEAHVLLYCQGDQRSFGPSLQTMAATACCRTLLGLNCSGMSGERSKYSDIL